MTIQKKLGLILSIVLTALIGGLFLSTKALAYNDNQINKATYAFKDANTIIMTIHTGGASTKQLTFTKSTADTSLVPSQLYNLSAGDTEGCNTVTSPPPADITGPHPPRINFPYSEVTNNPKGPIKATIEIANDNKDGHGCAAFDGANHSISITVPAGLDLSSLTVGTSGTGDDSGSGNTSACVANSNIGLEWLLCPIITSISKATDGINALVVEQLNFNVNENLNDKPGNDGVKVAWAAIKNIASAFVVILLLVIVISQALGGSGFLDAYTLRKMLPRLIVAVIAMQLSWYACRYAIGLANDAGHGIAQIMTSPFGGAGNLDLGSLLNRLSGWWAAGVSVTSVSLVVVLVAAPVIATAFLPGILLIIFTLFVSVLVALATLLFRNALIIALVIFSPIALLLWVLPGTQRYWKMWTSNFSKLLLLFPLMISIIYAGRIFAYIAGGLGTPGFLDLLAVLVGFFAPYFIIFKAFKWGGSAIAAANTAISTGINKMGEKPKKALQSAKESMSEQRAAEAGLRWANNKPSFLRGDYFRANQWTKAVMPGKSMESVRKRQLASLRAKGAALEGEEQKQRSEERQSYTARLKRLETDLADPEGESTNFYTAVANGELDSEFETHSGRKTIRDILETGEVSHTMRQAAMKHLTTEGQGGLRALDSIRNDAIISDDSEFRRAFEEFRIENGDQMFRVLPHWYKPTEAVANDTKPEAFTSMATAEAEAIVGELSHRAGSGDAIAARSLADFLQSFETATRDETIRGHIDKGVANVVLSYMQGSGANFEEVNRSMAKHAPNEQMAAERQMQSGGYSTQRAQLQEAVAQRYPADQGTQAKENFNVAVSRIVNVVQAGGQVRITAPGAPTVRSAQPGPGAVVPPSELVIPHDTPTGEVVRGTDFDIQTMVTRAGGWGGLSTPDLVRIYNYRTGDLKQQALAELQGRQRRRGGTP